MMKNDRKQDNPLGSANGRYDVMRLRAMALCLLLLGNSFLALRAEASGQVRLATGQELASTLAALHGKLVVLNLWGTWCTPCLKEIPDLMQLERELADHNLKLVAVAMDDPADLAMVDGFRARFFPDLDSYLRNEPDMNALVSVVDSSWNTLLPTTYLIGRDGRVIKRIQGKKSLEALRSEVKALLR